ncbi:hypothetical protein BDZ89DRAFT_102285 [Hymenopellis radicata]|nr:hypothetical protein BDZ89DRAFT_102285 [Hymenopellis radicata]
MGRWATPGLSTNVGTVYAAALVFSPRCYSTKFPTKNTYGGRGEASDLFLDANDVVRMIEVLLFPKVGGDQCRIVALFLFQMQGRRVSSAAGASQISRCLHSAISTSKFGPES